MTDPAVAIWQQALNNVAARIWDEGYIAGIRGPRPSVNPYERKGTDATISRDD